MTAAGDEKESDILALFKGTQGSGGVWPSDLHAYYNKIDDERGIPRPKLIQGYGQPKMRKKKNED